MENCTLSGSDFKALVKAVSTFPTAAGAFVGSDLIHLQAGKGYLTAAVSGTVLSRGRVKAEGELSLVGVDRRIVENYMPVSGKRVRVSLEEKKLFLRGRRETSTETRDGTAYAAPSIKDVTQIKMDAVMAERLAYLSAIAFADVSQANLNCVYLANGKAIACDQKMVAVLNFSRVKAGTAIPLPLARVVEPGNMLCVGERETVVKTEIVTHSMPSAIKAQKEFPIKAIWELEKGAGREPLASIEGERLASAVKDCSVCIGGLAKNEVVVNLRNADGKMQITARNGGADYRAQVPMLDSKPFAFRATLDRLERATPFFTGKVVLSEAAHGDLFVTVPDGWILFPAWTGKK